MKGINLYFDFCKKQGQIIIGAAAYERGKNLKYLFKKVERLSCEESAEYNQFHATIKALNLAVESLGEWVRKEKAEGVDVLFMNQNELVFRWLKEQNYGMGYRDLFSELEENILKVLELVEFGFMVIDGKDNKVKKMLKNEAADDSFGYQKLDFKGLRDKLGKTKECGKKKEMGEDNIVSIEKFRL